MRDTIRAMPTQAKNDVARVSHAELQRALAELDQIANMSLGSAGLAIGSDSAAAILIANTVPYLIGGVFKSKATAEVAFTATTHDIPADEEAVQEAVYLLTLQADGSVTITMGEIASGAGAAEIPDAPAGEAVIGHVRIAVAAGETPFDATSDDLDDEHLTVTYTNCAFLLPGAYARYISASR